MVTEIISLFSNLVRAAFLPQTLPEKLSAEDISKYGQWKECKQDIPGAWLPSCVRHIRYESLEYKHITKIIFQPLSVTFILKYNE